MTPAAKAAMSAVMVRRRSTLRCFVVLSGFNEVPHSLERDITVGNHPGQAILLLCVVDRPLWRKLVRSQGPMRQDCP
jgi:hypothetical protein